MPGSRYVADGADRVRLVELDGLVALFHVPSGMTHLLAPPAPQILKVIANNPGDASEIMERLSERFDVEGGEEAILSRLAELEASGLVRRSPAEAGAQHEAAAGPRLSPGNTMRRSRAA